MIKGLCEVTYVKPKEAWRPTRKHKYEELRWSLSHSNHAVQCVGVSAFRFSIVGVLSLVAITTRTVLFT